MDCCLIRLILIVLFASGCVECKINDEPCTLLIKYPTWLANKHAAYVKWNNETFFNNPEHQRRFKKLYESNYNERQDLELILSSRCGQIQDSLGSTLP